MVENIRNSLEFWPIRPSCADTMCSPGVLLSSMYVVITWVVVCLSTVPSQYVPSTSTVQSLILKIDPIRLCNKRAAMNIYYTSLYSGVRVYR